ncbi:MAG: multiheme c-type cytochrome [Bryobacterales bacterium]|nr:multiheme c-type cytochrome [Bryobacterales bacterium]
MTLERKQTLIIGLAALFMISLLIVAWVEGGRRRIVRAPDAVVTSENADCVTCHRVKSPGIVGQWEISEHAKSGIGCLQCHQAQPGDIDAYEHEGSLVSTIVTPPDCAECHAQETAEFDASHHSRGGEILGSLDNVLAEVVEGFVRFDDAGNKVNTSAAAVSGCLQCHGSEVKVLEDGRLDPATWPNTGIGRINPDGSRGSCTACHLRHDFSRAQARAPENCGRCHLGPDHPQLEVYQASKHGIAFEANRDRFEPMMEEKEWIPGHDFEQGPTCTSCHMSATRDLPLTHDVGERISWTLRPPVSEKIDAAAIQQGEQVKSWEDRRRDMRNVCESCHGPEWVGNWYKQYDDLVELYNEKFGRPSTELFQMARSSGLLTSVEFDEELEFTYFFLWHHEGRRARHGAAMMAPDYTQWHGMYEVAHRFYMELVPQVRELIEHNRTGPRAAAARRLETRLNSILESEMHRWFLGQTSDAEKAAREAAREAFSRRYAR